MCPSCKAEKDYKLNSGMEFMINRIEDVGHKPTEDAVQQEAASEQEAAAE